MSFYSIKGSYLADLIEELTTIELDQSTTSRTGKPLEALAIRASRYNMKAEAGQTYDRIMFALCQQVLTELSFLTTNQAENLTRRFAIIKRRLDEAWGIVLNYYNDFKQGGFKSMDFENDFTPLFNLPYYIGGSESDKFGDLITTKDFFFDLFDAIKCKVNASNWLIDYFRDIHLLELVSGKEELAASETENKPSRSIFIDPEIQKKLFDQLKKYVEQERHQDLQLVLDGHDTKNPIVLVGNNVQERLGEIMYNVKEKRGIQPRQWVSWAMYNFRRNQDGLSPEFNKNTLTNCLKDSHY